MIPGPKTTGVLLLGFGGPTRSEDIRPFLDQVLRGRPVPPARYEEVVKQYEAVGGASPFNALARDLAGALERQLESEGLPLPVHVAFRNSSPSVADALKEISRAGFRDVVAVVLSNFLSEPSWDRYLQAVQEALAGLDSAPRVRYAAAWYKDSLFIEAVSDRITEALQALPADRRASARWIFTAHSIPAAMDPAYGYSKQLALSSRLAARRLGQEAWTTAYQSRSGRPEDPWLEPDVGEAIRSCAGSARDVLVVPIGFLLDHVEVLFDLDIKARRQAEQAGLGFARAKTVGTHPAFLRALSERVRRLVGERIPS
jgi:protoporphyrin/coproporphyrin ferrochelatase